MSLRLDRRRFTALAAALGAELALGRARASASTVAWKERRDLFPQGVASGDPHPDSVILWTRRPPAEGKAPGAIQLEVAEDEAFRRVVARSAAHPIAEADWTVRVLAAGLKPGREYFYRFSDADGSGSRIGRTLTAPDVKDPRPVRFAFVSCQMVPAGACNAYRRMIFEDEKAPPDQRLGFVLHLGDFVYEIVWYPEDRAKYYARTLRDVVRYPTGEKISNFHVPTSVEDYRTLYRGYLTDPDLMDARARWPFVCMWDNHEFSWQGYQSLQVFSSTRPAAIQKVASCQAWFEYQPARVVKTGGDTSLERFVAPRVENAPVTSFDEDGLGQEPNNLAAIHSLTLYRTLRFGRNVELILTDNRSFRTPPVGEDPASDVFASDDFPLAASQEALEILDAGRDWNDGRPPDTIVFGKTYPNTRKTHVPPSMLGRAQKAWFLDQLARSDAPWKIWGNSVGSLDWRVDFQNLPSEFKARWPSDGYALVSGGDWSGYFHERGEILDFARSRGVTGLVSLAGDRHAFFAGMTSKSLPPRAFEPVGLEFVGASISSPGAGEAQEAKFPRQHPLLAAYFYEPPGGGPRVWSYDFTARHGVRSALEMQKTHDREAALKLHNPDVSPHLTFMDTNSHGYGVTTAAAESIEVEFVCIPRPLERNTAADGGPLRYRVLHRADLWRPGEAPRLVQVKLDGEAPPGA